MERASRAGNKCTAIVLLIRLVNQWMGRMVLCDFATNLPTWADGREFEEAHATALAGHVSTFWRGEPIRSRLPSGSTCANSRNRYGVSPGGRRRPATLAACQAAWRASASLT